MNWMREVGATSASWSDAPCNVQLLSVTLGPALPSGISPETQRVDSSVERARRDIARRTAAASGLLRAIDK